MGVPPPNYTQVPNIIFEMIPMMGEAELRVIMCIARQTFGWHKTKDRISLSQLETLTGLSRQGVLNGINDAMQHSFLRRYKVGDGYEYEIKVEELVNEIDRTSQQSRPPLVNEVDTQKKEININKGTKNTIADDSITFSPSVPREPITAEQAKERIRSALGSPGEDQYFSAAISSPREDKKRYVWRAANIIASTLDHIEEPSGSDLAAAKKMFEKSIPLDKIRLWCVEHKILYEPTEKYIPDAWKIFRDIDNWRARGYKAYTPQEFSGWKLG